MAAVAERTQIAALAGKTRQIGAVGQKSDYRFTTNGRSKTEDCICGMMAFAEE